jgi:hypothetical protein
MTTILLRRKPSNASSLQIPQSLQVPANLCFEPKQLRIFKLAIYICIMKQFVVYESRHMCVGNHSIYKALELQQTYHR